MKLIKFSIFFTALVYFIIGIACLSFPNMMANGADIVLSTSTARTDFRATYGGFLISMGIFFFFCLKDSKYFNVALILQAISLSGFAIGRTFGLILEGTTKPINYYILLAEIGGIILAIYCLRLINKTDKI